MPTIASGPNKQQSTAACSRPDDQIAHQTTLVAETVDLRTDANLPLGGPVESIDLEYTTRCQNAASSDLCPWRPYAEIATVLATGSLRVYENTVGFNLPKCVKSREQKERFRRDLLGVVAVAFPKRHYIPCVQYRTGRPGDQRIVEIDVTGSEVLLSEVLARCGEWRVRDRPLGPYKFVGVSLATDEVVLRIKKIPSAKLIREIDSILSLTLQDTKGSNTEAFAKDVWTHNLRDGHQKKFNGQVDVLVGVRHREAAREPYKYAWQVTSGWPGWITWEGYDLPLVFQGRFDYCARCKNNYDHEKGRHPGQSCPHRLCIYCKSRNHMQRRCPELREARAQRKADARRLQRGTRKQKTATEPGKSEGLPSLLCLPHPSTT